jgi:hypothetical protein
MYLPHRIKSLDDVKRPVVKYSMAQDGQVSNSKGIPGSMQSSAPDHSLWMLAKVLWEIASENANRGEISVPSIQIQHGHQPSEE